MADPLPDALLAEPPASEPPDSEPPASGRPAGDPAGGSLPASPYQALYRRYRPQRFADVLGQEPVTAALSNAVRDGRVAHAYLFSGPRGTGKTSTARILAMALNCEAPKGGEPDGSCQSCLDIRSGSSLDVQELDAASNRKLDEMRDLLSRVALGTRGRHKVYIIDEVHQLTPDAASALLKTLEEPPGHVVFVLATTDPQKVLPTIRSRTQHFEFRLLGSEVLAGLLAEVNQRAGLGLAPEAIDVVVRRGHGSARDALSVLDQVAAAGTVVDDSAVVARIVDAIADHDPPGLLVAVAEAVSAGREPRRLAADVLEQLRNAFLATQAPSLVQLTGEAVAAVEAQARRIGMPALVRAMESMGEAAVAMRESVDPRITLEAGLVRLAAPEADTTLAALLERVERLETMVGERATAAPGGPVRPAGVDAPSQVGAPPVLHRPATGPTVSGGDHRPDPQENSAPVPTPAGEHPPAPPTSRPALGAHRRAAPGAGGPTPPAPAPRPRPTASRPPAPPPDNGPPPLPPPRPAPAPATPRFAGAPPAPPPDRVPAASAPPVPSASVPRASLPSPTRASHMPSASSRSPVPSSVPAPGAGSLPSRDELTKAWGDAVLPSLRPGLKVYVSSGRFVEAGEAAAVFALPDPGLLSRAEPLRAEMEAALAAHFSALVPVRFVVDDGAAPPEGRPGGESGEEMVEDLDVYDLDQLEDAGGTVSSPEQRLLEAFPGAEEVSQ